jgi:hypothetical protein
MMMLYFWIAVFILIALCGFKGEQLKDWMDARSKLKAQQAEFKKFLEESLLPPVGELNKELERYDFKISGEIRMKSDPTSDLHELVIFVHKRQGLIKRHDGVEYGEEALLMPNLKFICTKIRELIGEGFETVEGEKREHLGGLSYQIPLIEGEILKEGFGEKFGKFLAEQVIMDAFCGIYKDRLLCRACKTKNGSVEPGKS